MRKGTGCLVREEGTGLRKEVNEMRRWNGLRLGLLTAVALALVLWVAAPVQAALVGWWEFDETGWDGTSNEVVDSSGSGNHGTAKGGATTVAGGKWGRAASLDGTNDWLDCGDNATYDLQDFTLTAWVNLGLDEAAGADLQIVDKNLQYSWRLDFDGQDKLQCIVWDSVTTPGHRGDQTNFNTGTWFHVAVVVSNNSFQHYIDGATDGSLNTGITPPLDTNGGVNLGIGANNAGAGNWFNGMIDDVRIYNTALTQSEVQQTMIPEPGSALLLGTGLLSLTFLVRRKRR